MVPDLAPAAGRPWPLRDLRSQGGRDDYTHHRSGPQNLQFCACLRMCPGIRLSALSSCVGCDTALALEARSRPARPGFLARCYRLRPLPHRPGLEEGMRHGNGNCGWSMSGPRRRDHPAHLFTGGYVRQVLGWVVQQGLAWVTRGTGWQRAPDHVRWP